MNGWRKGPTETLRSNEVKTAKSSVQHRQNEETNMGHTNPFTAVEKCQALMCRLQPPQEFSKQDRIDMANALERLADWAYENSQFYRLYPKTNVAYKYPKPGDTPQNEK
jgi:hypothetical protein